MSNPKYEVPGGHARKVQLWLVVLAILAGGVAVG